MKFRPMAIVPVFNHPLRVGQVVDALHAMPLDVLLVDDGSDATTANILDEIAVQQDVHLLRLPKNCGKGAAVSAGLEWAAQHDYTHALQVDADGQHDLADAPTLLEMARRSAHSLVSGKPVYDDSIPRSRLIGRYVTHAWVWLETLSFSIPDSMCGYRVYPVKPSLQVIHEEGVGQRMDFDTEIMVRLYWRGHDAIFLPTRVRYPQDGISHFRILADNWRITRMHTRLVFGMLRRLPWLLTRRRRDTVSWARIGERGSMLGMRFVVRMTGILGHRGTKILLRPIAAYYVVFHHRARQASRQYLAKVNARVMPELRDTTRPTLRNVYRHFLGFSHEAVSKLQAWQSGTALPAITISGNEVLNDYCAKGRGALLITAHLGNMEVSRALAAMNSDLKVNALVYTRNARKFTRLIEEFAPDFCDRLILVEEIGSDTIIQLRTLIERGEIVVIVGDRTPASENGRVVTADFLGEAAEFAVGPYLLGHLLECPVGLLFCVRDGERYHVTLERFANSIRLPRSKRNEQLSRLAQAYAARLEHHVLQAPLQWFNFFDFWRTSGTAPGVADGVSNSVRT